MIKARPNQQQPPNVVTCDLCGVVTCDLCGARFTNKRRLIQHLADVRHCPHDGHKCRHACKGAECWRELDGS